MVYNNIGWKTDKPKPTYYVWTQIPEQYCDIDCMEFVKKLIELGVVITPGIGFGEYGEGFVRFALTQPVERINEALERIENGDYGICIDCNEVPKNLCDTCPLIPEERLVEVPIATQCVACKEKEKLGIL